MTKFREIQYSGSDWPIVRFIKRKRQKYIRIRVADEHITVSAPWYSSLKEMENFLMEKQQWVDNTLRKISVNKRQLDTLREKNGNKILLRGVWKPLIHNPWDKNGRWQFIEQDDRVLYGTPDGRRRPPDPDTIYQFYRRLADTEIRQRLMRQAAELPFSFEKVFIRSQKTKWGTCSSQGNLSFNWRLIKCPMFVLDYLIIHELCHTVHMNHSGEFWKLVGRHCPDYERAKLWIREHGALVFSEP